MIGKADRRRPGRKARPADQNRTVRLPLQLTQAEYDALEAHAVAHKTTMAELVRSAVNEAGWFTSDFEPDVSPALQTGVKR